MSCKNCKKKTICIKPCDTVQKQLDNNSFACYKASWYEKIGYRDDALEFLLNIKNYAGKHSFFDSINNIYNEENIVFIKYLIIKYLSKKQRYALITYYFKNLTQQEIAKKTNVKPPTVNFHIKQGIKKLKKMIVNLL